MSWAQDMGGAFDVTSPILTTRGGTPSVVDPLPAEHRRGLIGVGVASLLSTITTTVLFIIITWRLVFWRKYYDSYIGYNQYIILIYNLLLADLQEALGFLISLHWVYKDYITKYTPVCFAQGWLLQIGDPSSGLFVLAIAVHTFYTVLWGRKLKHRTFVCYLVGLWVFCLLLPIVPLAVLRSETWAPTGPWCWIDDKYDIIRLWVHYFWIFLSEFGSIVLYLILYVYLRRKISTAAVISPGQQEHLHRVRRVTGYMVLYPLAYLVLSLPLAAGRMATASGQKLSITYFCTAGAMISCSGVVDVIMYALTRRALLLNSQLSGYQDRAVDFSGQRHTHTATTISAPTDRGMSLWPKDRGASYARRYGIGSKYKNEPESSAETIVGDVELSSMQNKVYQETTIEITHEDMPNRHRSSPSDSSVSGVSLRMGR